MRLRILGIPKTVFMFLGCMPVLLWSALHVPVLSYHEHGPLTAVCIGLACSLIFTYFLRRGFFGLRFGVILLMVVVFIESFLTSMVERDFVKLALTLCCFGACGVILSWFEGRIQSAHVNPKVKWFEGVPKFLPHLEAKLKIGESWKTGRVGAIDRGGFFVFLDETFVKFPRGRISFELKFKTMEIQGETRMNAHFYGPAAGFGLQFLPKDLYHFSQYTALVERLKGEGL